MLTCWDSWLKIADTKGRSDGQVENATHDTALYMTIRLGYEKGMFFSSSPPKPPHSSYIY